MKMYYLTILNNLKVTINIKECKFIINYIKSNRNICLNNLNV